MLSVLTVSTSCNRSFFLLLLKDHKSGVKVLLYIFKESQKNYYFV